MIVASVTANASLHRTAAVPVGTGIRGSSVTQPRSIDPWSKAGSSKSVMVLLLAKELAPRWPGVWL